MIGRGRERKKRSDGWRMRYYGYKKDENTYFNSCKEVRNEGDQDV